MRKLFFIIFVFLFSSFVVASPTLDTPQITAIVVDEARESVNIFNDGDSSEFTAYLEKESSVLSIEDHTILAEKESYLSFTVIINEESLDRGVHFNSLLIYHRGERIFKIPIILIIEPKRHKLPFDVSILVNEDSDISTVSSEIIISPSFEVYKLDYNYGTTSEVVLAVEIYNLDGELLQASEPTQISVSSKASLERFFNVQNIPEVVVVASVESGGLRGYDLQQISLPSSLLFSPDEGKDYSVVIYSSVFAFLILSIILLSYYWNRRVMLQAKDWRQHIDHIKKTGLTDLTIAKRKIDYQRDLLSRAYDNHYITKESYRRGIAEINKLTSSLKKRL